VETSRSILVIGQPGQLRDSLLVLLKAVPRIGRVEQADDVSSALTMSREIRPALVLVDHDRLGDKASSRVRAAWPQARYVALVDSEQACHDAESAGADAALVKGVRADRLLATIEDLLLDW
jgi:DNA-binding NarL/FixJ family response regulator